MSITTIFTTSLSVAQRILVAFAVLASGLVVAMTPADAAPKDVLGVGIEWIDGSLYLTGNHEDNVVRMSNMHGGSSHWWIVRIRSGGQVAEQKVHSLSGSVYVNLGAGNDSFGFNHVRGESGNHSNLPGSLIIEDQNGDDEVSMNGFRIDGDLQVDLGPGDNRAWIFDGAVHGDIRYDGVNGEDEVRIRAVTDSESIRVVTGGGDDIIELHGDPGNIVTGQFALDAGGGDDWASLRVSGSTLYDARGGAGADTIYAGGGSSRPTVDGGNGDDEIWLSMFHSSAIDLTGGNDDDTLIILYQIDDGDSLRGGAGNDVLFPAKARGGGAEVSGFEGLDMQKRQFYFWYGL